ncbi:MAG TPA: SDR family NAD(P)-dependent oxidoreductase [Coleofasciculaceae cyanobacterium]|jgi:acyl transferase domain-containing protein/acyl carrier protein
MSDVNLSEATNGAENSSDIAIVGISGRFPGAANIDTFWQNLRNGVESVSFFSDEELLASGIDPTALSDPNYVKAKSILSDIDRFDAEFFGFSPKEAERMDPQHRLFLESAWEAIEQAGYNPETYAGAIGVYAGAETNTYLLHHISPTFGGFPDLQTFLGNATDYLSTRVSYKLNLKGASVTVQTACSTSLVAVHLASQSLLNGECDLALAGGISVTVPQKTGYFYQEGGIASPDGHCRTFDAKAQGSFFGNGVGIVVLKRLSEAIADGDCIHAVIKGSAINNDGALKVGYTAPSPEGQAAVIAEAQAIAGITPDSLTYIEAHGSGTALGDPIEIAALTQVFRHQTDQKAFCAIGSVKSNFGHLGIAAGVAGLIKTVLALKHKQIPPSLHFEQPNPEIDFVNSPFYVNTQLREWKTHGHPRRAGVSSFGIGGTNAHVILEEAPPVSASASHRPWQLLTLSAKTSSALEQATANLTEHLQHHPDLNLADVAYTLQVGRQPFAHRQTVVCQDLKDTLHALQYPKRVLTSVQEKSHRPIAFMFTGLGTQYVNMGWELYQAEPTFREQVDRCCQFLQPLMGLDLRDILYPAQNQVLAQTVPQSGFDLRQMLGRKAEPTDAATQTLNQTRFTQPAIFVIEYALAQLWLSWGIRPVAMIGYSIGEYVAACLSGVLSLEDALTLVANRAQIIEKLPGGAMLAVPLSEAEITPLLNENLSLSAINGANLCVIAGTIAAVDQLATDLAEQGLACRRLQTSHAFHSHQMEPIAAACTTVAQTLDLKAPQIPYVSNVTGTWMTTAAATDPSYWTKHLCQPVRFADGITALWNQHQPILLEIGPGQTLSSLAIQCLESTQKTEKVVLPSLRDAYNQQSDSAFLLNTLGQLWLSGLSIDWSQFHAHEHRHRVPLPTYPFERQRYWIDPPKPTGNTHLNPAAFTQKLEMAQWFHCPSWKRAAPLAWFEPEKLEIQPQCWLVFLDPCGVGSRIVEQLDRAYQNIITVTIGEQFSQLSERNYRINPANKEDYDRLLKTICGLDKNPERIIHLWNATSNQERSARLEHLEQSQALGFYSLLFLVQTLADQNISRSIQIDVISNHLQEITDEDQLCPEKATILGLCKVIPQEYANIACRSIDITLPDSQEWQKQQGLNLINLLMAELVAEPVNLFIAHRGNRRWIQCFEPVPVKDNVLCTPQLRQGGVYVITGGLGGIGLAIARYFAETVQAKLVLIGRSGLPPRSEWQSFCHDEKNPIRTQIEQVQRLEALGAEVLMIQADVTSLEQMQAAVKQVRDRFGTIHGVIHAAGVPGAGLMQLKTAELAAQVLDPKVKGTLVLEAVLQDIQLDFWVLCSSLTAIYGGLGQVDYCAANAFLDAFAHDDAARHQRRTISINWDWWQWDSWQDSLLSFAPDMQAEFKQMRQQYGITFQEGIKAFSHILSGQLPQVVVSTRNLQAVIEQHETFALGSFTEKPSHVTSTHPRPHLRTAYVAPSTAIEHQLTELYQEFLAIESVGIYDNFLDLGGHSLLATQLVSRLRQDFQVEVSLRSFLEAPSIAELALLIEEKLVEELEELSEADAEKLILANP